MLLSGSGLDGTVNAVADTNLCKRFERHIGRRVILPDGREQAKHSFLNEILAVTADEKKRPRANAHQAAIALCERFLRVGIPGTHQCQQLCIRQFGIIHHNLQNSNTTQNKL